MWFFGRKKKKMKKEEDKVVEAKVEESKQDSTCEEKPSQEVEEKKTVSEKKETKKSQLSKEKAQKSQEKPQESAKKSLYRVMYDKEDKLWKIKKDGAKRIIDSKKTKEEALKRVQELSNSQEANFVVYKKDGKFQKKANLKLKNLDE